jgi:hypothetical protein
VASLDPTRFTRRFNEDGTIDSICRHCFLTVATAQSDADLANEERKHTCDPYVLERFREPNLAKQT